MTMFLAGISVGIALAIGMSALIDHLYDHHMKRPGR